jgi:hypothetical protein
MYRFLKIVLFSGQATAGIPAQARAGEQMPLKLRNSGGFQPHPPQPALPTAQNWISRDAQHLMMVVQSPGAGRFCARWLSNPD